MAPMDGRFTSTRSRQQPPRRATASKMRVEKSEHRMGRDEDDDYLAASETGSVSSAGAVKSWNRDATEQRSAWTNYHPTEQHSSSYHTSDAQQYSYNDCHEQQQQQQQQQQQDYDAYGQQNHHHGQESEDNYYRTSQNAYHSDRNDSEQVYGNTRPRYGHSGASNASANSFYAYDQPGSLNSSSNGYSYYQGSTQSHQGSNRQTARVEEDLRTEIELDQTSSTMAFVKANHSHAQQTPYSWQNGEHDTNGWAEHSQEGKISDYDDGYGGSSSYANRADYHTQVTEKGNNYENNQNDPHGAGDDDYLSHYKGGIGGGVGTAAGGYQYESDYSSYYGQHDNTSLGGYETNHYAYYGDAENKEADDYSGHESAVVYSHSQPNFSSRSLDPNFYGSDTYYEMRSRPATERGSEGHYYQQYERQPSGNNTPHVRRPPPAPMEYSFQQQQQQQQTSQRGASDLRLPKVEEILTGSVPNIFSLTRHNRYNEVEELLDAGLPVDTRDRQGNTILSIACQNGLKRIAKLALRRGANINTQNCRGNTPLHFCYMYQYGDTLGTYLLSKGADPTLVNADGKVCHEVGM